LFLLIHREEKCEKVRGEVTVGYPLGSNNLGYLGNQQAQYPWAYYGVNNQPLVPIYGRGVMTDDFFTFDLGNGGTTPQQGDQFQGTAFGQQNAPITLNNGIPQGNNNVVLNGGTPGQNGFYDINTLGTHGATDDFFQFDQGTMWNPDDPNQMGPGPVPPTSPFDMPPSDGEWDGQYRDASGIMPADAMPKNFTDKLIEPGSTLTTGLGTYMTYAAYMKQLTNTNALWEGGRVVGNFVKGVTSLPGKTLNVINPVGKDFLNVKSLVEPGNNAVKAGNTAFGVLHQQQQTGVYLESVKSLGQTANNATAVAGVQPQFSLDQVANDLSKAGGQTTKAVMETGSFTQAPPTVPVNAATTSVTTPSADQFLHDAAIQNAFQTDEVNKIQDLQRQIDKTSAKSPTINRTNKVANLEAQQNALAAQAAEKAANAQKTLDVQAAFAKSDAGKVYSQINGQSFSNLADKDAVLSNLNCVSEQKDLAALYNNLDKQGLKTLNQLDPEKFKAASNAAKVVNVGQINELANAGNVDALTKMVANEPLQANRAAYIKEMQNSVNKDVSKEVMKRTKVNANGSGFTVSNVATTALSAVAIGLTVKQIVDRFKSKDPVDKGAATVAAVGGAAAGAVCVAAAWGAGGAAVAGAASSLFGASGAAAASAATGLGATSATLSAAATGIGSVAAVAFAVADSIKYFANGEWERGSVLLGCTAAGAVVGSIIPGLGTLVGAALGAVVGCIANIFVGKGKAQRKARDEQIIPSLNQSLSKIIDTAKNEAGKAAYEASKIGNFAKIPEVTKLSKTEIDKQLHDYADQLSKLGSKDEGKKQKILKQIEDLMSKVANQEYIDKYNREIELLSRKNQSLSKKPSSGNPFANAINNKAKSGGNAGGDLQQQQVEAWLNEYIQQNPSMASKSQDELLQGFQAWLVSTNKVAA